MMQRSQTRAMTTATMVRLTLSSGQQRSARVEPQLLMDLNDFHRTFLCLAAFMSAPVAGEVFAKQDVYQFSHTDHSAHFLYFDV